jgi:ribosome hibernation promoting factor
MQLSVTFRHMDSTDALRDYAKEKVERIRKYFPDPIKAHVVLVCDRGYNHTADVMITLHNGLVIKGVETTEDMYSSIDLVMAKIERQVRRYKEKIRSHKGAEGLHGQREIIHSCSPSRRRRRRARAPMATRTRRSSPRSSRSRSSLPSR